MTLKSALGLGILANALGGSSYVLQKLALEGYPPATLITARLLICLPLLWLSCPKGWRKAVTPADWLRLVVIGIFGLAAPHLVGIFGLRDSDAISGAILIGLEPVAIVVLARLFLGEELRAGQAAGVAFALVGAAVVITRGDLSSALALDTSTRGAVMLALSGSLWAIYTVLAKPTLVRVSASALTAVTSTIAVFVVLPVSSVEWHQLDPAAALSPGPALAMLSMALGVSYGGTVLWNRALASLTATEMAVLIFVQPVTGVFLGVMIGEPLHASLWIGAALVFGGVWLSHSFR